MEPDPTEQADGLVRVYFRLDPDDWHGHPNEGLWAEPVGRATPGTALRLRNSPFFARGVSFHDIVRAVPSADGAGMEFAGVIDHAGHSTYMILVDPVSPWFPEYWDRMQSLGCTYEWSSIDTKLGTKKLYSVDVPASSDIYMIYNILEEGERNGVWMFQEGHVGHELNKAPLGIRGISRSLDG